MGLLFGCRSHVGQVRDLNEDSYLAMAAPAITHEIAALLVVADGVGGHLAGEVASGYVVDTFRQLFASPAYQRRVDYNPQREDYYAAVLKEVLEQINAGLQEMTVGRRGLSGMGTTATVALLTGNRLFIGHVGDTRAYLLRDGQLHQLTTDHSWVEEQVQAGVLTPQQAASHPRRNVLTRSLGNRPVVRVDRSIHTLEARDTLLLCSDGLTNKVSAVEITKVLQGNGDPQKVCDSLVELANQRGGEDNMTVLLLRLSDRVKDNNLPGGLAIGPRVVEMAEEAAATQKIRHRKVSVRAPGAIMPTLAAFLFAVVVVAVIALSAIITMLVVQRYDPALALAAAAFSGLSTLAGVLIGLLGGALIPRD
jgi:serine/threonine protein phosphatase PrpC